MKARHLLLCCFLSVIAHTAYSQAAAEFVENQGQWGSWFKYKAISLAGEVYLENDGFRYLLCDPANGRKIDSVHLGLLDTPTVRFHVYKMTFEGANMQPDIVGNKPQKNYYNYYYGNDPKRWKSGIHPYQSLDYNDLYPGINMHVTSEVGSLVYEFFVQPGADVSQIKLNFDGPDRMYTKDGNLYINTSVGQVVEMKPNVFQYINGDKKEVACSYRLKHNQVTFDFPDGYDHSAQLIIDPTIAFWCSFTGSTADNWGFTATYDNTGDFYLAGLVNALSTSAGGLGGAYPVSPGAYQSTFGGGQGNTAIEYAADIGVMKLSPDGVSRIYATYIGGSCNERPHSIIVDASDNLIIAGRTHSTDYPVTAGAYQTANHGGWDIVVSKLNSTGTAMLASTYIGGSTDDGVNFDSTEVGYGHLKWNYGDDARSEVQVDNLGNVYVTGNTTSTDFPTTAGALSTTYGGGMQDGVAFKLNSTLSSLLWSSYIGGNGDDAGYVLTFNPTQTSFYIAGGTNSTNFPTIPGCWQTTYMGDSSDGFILKFRNSPPYTLQKGTYVGTSHFDQVYGIQIDNLGTVWVMGQSLGGTFPVTGGVYTNPNSSQFVMKIDSNLGTDLISTVYGSGDAAHTNISPVAFLVDTCNNVYISGWGGNIMGAAAPGLAHSGTTVGMPITSDAFQSTTDGYDFYFIVFGADLATLRYATFYGRNAPGGYGEHVDGGTSRFDKHGIIYQAICANCGGSSGPPFPTTAGVWAPTDMSGNCNEAALKISFNIGPVQAIVTAGPSTNGCAPLTVNFTNTSNNGLSFVWNFGDGSPIDTLYSPTHTFTASGTFTVSLSAANSNACFVTNDTAYLIIRVDTNYITPGFTTTVTDSCGPYTVTVNNTSVDHTSGTSTYQWWFGNGSVFTGANPPIQNYADTGTYTITLVMSNDSACHSPDTVIEQVHIYNQRVSAHFIIPDSICAGTPFTPSGGATNAATTTWYYGNGLSTTDSFPTFTYDSVGIDTITLIALNSGACNGGDTVTETIKVLPLPVANFSFIPLTPTANVPTTFTNLSLNATRYTWDFGDNTASTEVNPIHQYTKTGNYKVCLTAYNNSNCPSVLCKTVPADVEPELGLPTAFSPNGDGENDILYVRGAAIVTLDLKIFNRWGQLVFETTSQDKGWDGKYNGQPQPIDAYAYVLNATFIDGSAKLLKGNITLLR